MITMMSIEVQMTANRTWKNGTFLMYTLNARSPLPSLYIPSTTILGHKHVLGWYIACIWYTVNMHWASAITYKSCACILLALLIYKVCCLYWEAEGDPRATSLWLENNYLQGHPLVWNPLCSLTTAQPHITISSNEIRHSCNDISLRCNPSS